jgi:hypothetical protein
MEEKRNSYSFLVGKPEANNQIGRSIYRNEDNIKMDVKETEWNGVDWVYPAQNTRWFKYDRDLCGLFTHKSVPVIFEPPCVYKLRIR